MITLKRFAVAVLSVLGLATQARAATPPASGAEVMRDLRLRALTAPAKDFGLAPTSEFPRTYGVLIDFPIGGVTATIVGFRDGNASLYTTSTFGVIGGVQHDEVRKAAAKLVGASDRFFDSAKPTSEFPYPAQGKVRFYLVSFGGVRMLESDLSAIESNQDKHASLFWLGQELLTRLRLATEKR